MKRGGEGTDDPSNVEVTKNAMLLDVAGERSNKATVVSCLCGRHRIYETIRTGLILRYQQYLCVGCFRLSNISDTLTPSTRATIQVLVLRCWNPQG